MANKKKKETSDKHQNSFFVGQKIPHLKHGYLKVMAYAEGYYMARYKGCTPFCCKEQDLIKKTINCTPE